MDHMTGVLHLGDGAAADRVEPPLDIGTRGVAAVGAGDDEHRAFDAAKKLDRLLRVKGLRRSRAMERVELPHPASIFDAPHACARQLEREFGTEPRIFSSEAVRGGFETRVLY